MTQPKVGQGVARSRGRRVHRRGRVRDELVEMHLAKRRAARWTGRAGGQVEESQGRSWAWCHTRRHLPPPSQRSGKKLRVVNISRSAPEAIEALGGKVNREVVRVAWSVLVVGEHILDELDGTEVESGLAP